MDQIHGEKHKSGKSAEQGAKTPDKDMVIFNSRMLKCLWSGQEGEFEGKDKGHFHFCHC